AIFHEHLLEHMPIRAGLALTDDCYRALKTGGVLRVVVPNVEPIIRAYAANEELLASRAPTRLIALQAMFYEYGHTATYDAETLITMLRTAGFETVAQREFGQSWLADVPDTESRRF